MKKTYSADLVRKLEEQLAKAPALEPRYYTHEELMEKIKDQVRELYQQKHYEPREIVKCLREGGVSITQREIKQMLGDVLRPLRRAKNTIAKL